MDGMNERKKGKGSQPSVGKKSRVCGGTRQLDHR